MMDHHYRTDWEWNDRDLAEGIVRRDQWRSATAGDGSAGLEAVRACLDNDLDTPGALRAIDAAAAQGLSVVAAAALLGVSLER